MLFYLDRRTLVVIMNKCHERVAASAERIFIIGKASKEAADGREI
jgi:hypothetical protein